MTEQQFKKAKELHERLEQLEEVNKEIKNDDYHKGILSYIILGGDYCSEWEFVNNEIMNYIRDILDRHDQQIRQEIDDEIEKLKKEIEAL